MRVEEGKQEEKSEPKEMLREHEKRGKEDVYRKIISFRKITIFSALMVLGWFHIETGMPVS